MRILRDDDTRPGRARIAGVYTALVAALLAGSRFGQTLGAGRKDCRTIVDFVATGLRDEASRALTVAHLRIESVQPLREWTLAKQCYTGSAVGAVVVDAVDRRRAGTRLRFVPIKSPTRPPYEPGDEIVVALQRDPASKQYFSWGYGYRVTNGVVSLQGAGPIDEFEEDVPVGVLFERLRDGTARRRR